MPEYKSKEELYFSWWLEEAKEKGYIDSYEYECEKFPLSEPVTNTYEKQLKTKAKETQESILHGHLYTPDFKINWNEKARGVFYGFGKQSDLPFKLANFNRSFVEIKGGFDQGNMTRLFVLNQKWVYEKYGILINLIKITNKKGGFFDKTFTPRRFMLTDKLERPKNLADFKYTPKFL